MGTMSRKNIGMPYTNRKRKSQAIWSIWSDFDCSGYKKVILIVKSVSLFYEVRVKKLVSRIRAYAGRTTTKMVGVVSAIVSRQEKARAATVPPILT